MSPRPPAAPCIPPRPTLPYPSYFLIAPAAVAAARVHAQADVSIEPSKRGAGQVAGIESIKGYRYPVQHLHNLETMVSTAVREFGRQGPELLDGVDSPSMPSTRPGVSTT